VAGAVEALEQITLREVGNGYIGNGYIVDTPRAVADLVDTLLDLPIYPPSLYLDIEGVELGRDGSVSIVQLLVLPTDLTYLIDIHTLADSAFTTAGSRGKTLKAILEDASIPKVFFDVRNDSDALYSHFGVALAGIQDIQLMELATRYRSKKFLNGLARCIQYDLSLGAYQQRKWMEQKNKGKRLFAPELGGSYEVFNQRPMLEDVALYCTQDVQFMPRLWSLYAGRMTSAWRSKVRVETLKRVSESQAPHYNGKGRDRAMGPW
jgi:exonuclease 3'-5' domain-containing protein 1